MKTSGTGHRPLGRGGLRVGTAILAVVALFSILAPLLAPHEPNTVDLTQRLQGPGGVNLLGTDSLGRDVLSRVLHGGRTSILLALLASACTMVLGLAIGVVAGYFGGWIDSVVLIVTSMLQGLPGISVMIALAGIMGPGILSLLTALVVVSWSGFSRIVRGEVMKLREEQFVEGVRSLGAGRPYVLVRHVIPNMIGPIIVLFATRISFAVLAISGLSFLGLGIQPPTSDWGVMIRDAMVYFREQPLLIMAPGCCLLLTTVGVNLLGDGLRDLFDVRVVGPERSE